jgi:hypothetical protein
VPDLMKDEGKVVTIGASCFHTGMDVCQLVLAQPAQQLGGTLGRIWKGGLVGAVVMQKSHGEGVLGDIDTQNSAYHQKSSSVFAQETDQRGGATVYRQPTWCMQAQLDETRAA